MANEGTLDQNLATWAQEVRLLAAKGAHDDPLEDVAPEQALDLATLVRQLLDYLYEQPARLARLRSSRPSQH